MHSLSPVKLTSKIPSSNEIEHKINKLLKPNLICEYSYRTWEAIHVYQLSFKKNENPNLWHNIWAITLENRSTGTVLERNLQLNVPMIYAKFQWNHTEHTWKKNEKMNWWARAPSPHFRKWGGGTSGFVPPPPFGQNNCYSFAICSQFVVKNAIFQNLLGSLRSLTFLLHVYHFFSKLGQLKTREYFFIYPSLTA